MRRLIPIALLALPAVATATIMPYYLSAGSVRSEVFVTEDVAGRFSISPADAVRFGARLGLTEPVVLENPKVNRNRLEIEAQIPLSAMEPVALLGRQHSKVEVLPQITGAWLNYSIDAKKTATGVAESLMTDTNISLPFGGVFRHIQINGTESRVADRVLEPPFLQEPGRFPVAVCQEPRARGQVPLRPRRRLQGPSERPGGPARRGLGAGAHAQAAGLVPRRRDAQPGAAGTYRGTAR